MLQRSFATALLRQLAVNPVIVPTPGIGQERIRYRYLPASGNPVRNMPRKSGRLRTRGCTFFILSAKFMFSGLRSKLRQAPTVICPCTLVGIPERRSNAKALISVLGPGNAAPEQEYPQFHERDVSCLRGLHCVHGEQLRIRHFLTAARHKMRRAIPASPAGITIAMGPNFQSAQCLD